jgi:hypothetical protein
VSVSNFNVINKMCYLSECASVYMIDLDPSAGSKTAVLLGSVLSHLDPDEHGHSKSAFTLIDYFAMPIFPFGVLLPPMVLEVSWFLFLVGVCSFFCNNGDLLARFVLLSNSNAVEQVNHLHRTITCMCKIACELTLTSLM